MKKIDYSWLEESVLTMESLPQDTGFITLASTSGATMALGSLEKATVDPK